MRVFSWLVAGMLASCTRLEGFSTPGQGSAGFALRTQANAHGDAMTSFELTPAGGTQAGDLLYFVVWTSPPVKIPTPDGLTLVDSQDDQCVPSGNFVFTATATDSVQYTQKFTLEAPAKVEATLLVLLGVDPAVRGKSVGRATIDGTQVRAPDITAGVDDAPGHVLLAFTIGSIDNAPAGTTALTKQTSTSVFSLPFASAGQISPPAVSVTGRCGIVFATLFKDR